MRKLKKNTTSTPVYKSARYQFLVENRSSSNEFIDGDRSFFRIFHRNEKFIRNSVFRCGTVLHLKLYYVGFRN